MKRILIIEHGGYLKEFTFKKLIKKGCTIYLATTKCEDWLFPYVKKDNILITNTFNSQDLLIDITTWIVAKKIRFDAVGTFKESAVIFTSDIADALGFINVGSGPARRSSQNKLLMRNYLKQNGYKNQPDFKIINVSDKTFPDIRCDSVIKPLFGSSSHGVVKVNKGSDLRKVIELALNSMSPNEREAFKNFKGHFLLEKYIPGKVYSVDGVIQDNKLIIAGIVEFIMGAEPYFTQIASIIPANITKSIEDELLKNTKEVLSILKFNNCGFHAEFRVHDNRPYLLEIAARLPGGGIQLGYRKSRDIDLTDMIIDIWLGKKVKTQPKNIKYVMHYSVIPNVKSTSILKKVFGLDKVKKLKYVWDFYQFMKEGDKVLTYPDTPSQVYYFAIEADSREELMRRADEIKSLVTIETESL
jgi:biotin carboxylase